MPGADALHCARPPPLHAPVRRRPALPGLAAGARRARQRVPAGPEQQRRARRGRRRHAHGHHPGRGHRAERAAPRARQAQPPRTAAGRAHCRAARPHAGRTGGRLRARGPDRPAERPHALGGNDLDPRRRVPRPARRRGAVVRRARLHRHRAHRRPRRLPVAAEAGRRPAEPRMARPAGARALHRRLLRRRAGALRPAAATAGPDRRPDRHPCRRRRHLAHARGRPGDGLCRAHAGQPRRRGRRWGERRPEARQRRPRPPRHRADRAADGGRDPPGHRPLTPSDPVRLPPHHHPPTMPLVHLLAPILALFGAAPAAAAQPAAATVDVAPGVMPVPDPKNLYSETTAGRISPNTAGALERVYVPNHRANTVSVIDPATLKVTHTFKVGLNPQHVVPSWDLKTLYVANNAENSPRGSLTVIDPKTAKPGATIPVDDPYNMYWSPDGKHAIVVAEAFKRLDFRDPKTFALDFSIDTPDCKGINHADFAIDSRTAFFTCEFNGAVTKIDLINRKVLGTLALSQYYDRPDALALVRVNLKTPTFVPDPKQAGGRICVTPGMPQDARLSPDGRTLYVADMMSDGVHVVDAQTLKQIGFVKTGVGAHGLYPSRDGKLLYVANRGSNYIHGKPKGKGSVSVIDFATGQVVKTWPIPGGGSPEIGNVSADGKHLWLSGRFDDVVYRIDTGSGAVDVVKVGKEPHGLAVWPLPGRYNLGHTGNLR